MVVYGCRLAAYVTAVIGSFLQVVGPHFLKAYLSHNACVWVSFSTILECPGLQCRNHLFPTPSVHRSLIVVVIVVIVPSIETFCRPRWN